MTTFQNELLHLRRLLDTGLGRELDDRIENTEIVLDELLAALQGREEQSVPKPENKPVVIPDKCPTIVKITLKRILGKSKPDCEDPFPYDDAISQIWQAISQHLRTL